MTYYSKKEYKLTGYQKSKRKHKKYDALLENKKTGRIVKVPFGDKRYENFRDLTGLNLYEHLIHNDAKRRRLYRQRHNKDLKTGYYSPGWFSYYITW
jgi:hypothetical protein